MRRPLFLFFLTALCSTSFSQVTSKSKMFRDNPVHSSFVSTNADLVYDSKAWRFDAGSPVRSTPLINDNTVYFGTAAGVFFALDKRTSQVKWKYNTGNAIHSSAASQDGKTYFSDNGQTLYCLKESNGQLLWKVKLGEKAAYSWRYDYYYSSPVLYDNTLLIGSDDGCLYALNPKTGKQLWKFKSKGIIRSTAAVYKNAVLFGDTEASLYAVDIKNGKELWQYRINGDTMHNEDYGFDRRAITSSPVIVGNKAVFGARDGFLYCINADNGKGLWKMDHYVSWVISTVAVKDSFVVTGTSDGRFVQAVHLETGKEIWKFRTPLAVWSSPLIIDDKVYAGTFDGQLYCIDLKTGKRISQFKVNGKILSSPVWDDGLLYFGADDGYLYALSGHSDKRQFKDKVDQYVYYETGVNVYYKANSDLVIRNYLRGNGYKLISSDSLAYFMSKESANPSVFVFATSYFPSSVIDNGKSSIMRKYLDRGGKIVMTGINPIVYQVDEKSKQPFAFRPSAADTILDLDYGKGDTRTFMGDLPCFPAENGKQLGLPDFWSTSLFIQGKSVDVVLGKNENGDVSAFAKNYPNGGQFIQLWMDADRPDRLDAIIKAAEWKIE
ncbi:MAG: PQQ-binding-like beta-propeller repeat protein [Chitinophagaceae bacterium]|nr:PQQ-binding-like beta-propeller repeat protein [Chitinophagaceae bacterium]